ncbi:MAG: aminopeptidase [Clostridia bacterium]|nr:aminopeptidase [Clostridia bacterium]
MEKEKNAAELLMEKLAFKKEHFSKAMSDEEILKADGFCEGYKHFLQEGKTERECVEYVLEKAAAKGFTEFDKTKTYKAGDKVYVNNRGKSVILAVMGKNGAKEGVKIVASHIDSPRLDLKPTPLYEDSELAYFKTHYYGGIKKYQWVAIPLSLHGVMIKADGESVKINIGEKEGEPKFVVTDLLPHLGKEQGTRNLNEGIKGEELNILIGSRPFKSDAGSELVKLNILNILHEKYGVTEKDFISAELELVPAFPVSDIGFDRSLIGAYGHDDRVCAYPAMEAVFDCDAPERTIVTVLSDKEEVGSDGNTGLNSSYLKYFIYDLADMDGVKGRDVLSKSECLSADVNAGFDPNFPSVHDKYNCCTLNHGAVITKYTGARGKSGTSDASAEFMGKVRRVLDNANVSWQIGELGKVDEGGGGTVAMYIANLGVDVVDLGVPVLSMHAPYEIVSKFDVYSTYRACYEFYKAD